MSTVSAQGYGGGSVTFDGHFLEIKHGGAERLVIGKGTKRIPVTQISAINIKPAGWLVNGVFSVSLPGGNEIRSRYGRTTYDAGFDPNAVRFLKKHEPEFLVLRDAVEQAMVELQRVR